MAGFIAIFTILFIAASGILFYKLVVWNSEKRHMIHATRDIVEEYGARIPPGISEQLRQALEMPPLPSDIEK